MWSVRGQFLLEKLVNGYQGALGTCRWSEDGGSRGDLRRRVGGHRVHSVPVVNSEDGGLVRRTDVCGATLRWVGAFIKSLSMHSKEEVVVVQGPSVPR